MSSSPKTDLSAVTPEVHHWHTHAAAEVLMLLQTRLDGLSGDEVRERQKEFGHNVFTEERVPTVLERIVRQFRSPITLVLVAAFVLTAALQEYIDAVVIALALLIAVAVGLVQEGKASRAFRKLADSQEHTAQVVRGGEKYQIPAADLVPGDIVLLQSGMQVPADLRLVKVKNLSINESTLTGEWLSVEKTLDPVPVGTTLAEQSDMAWMGTFVSQGTGQGVVVEIGDKTAVGALAQGLKDVQEEQTPLQREMEKVSRIMLYLIIALVVLIFVIGIVQGQSVKEMVLMSIAIAVASIPEGLPAAVTIILAVGMEALLKRGGLVRNLLAAETLGSTTYVLTDKTGTLTEGKMAVAGLIIGGQFQERTDAWQYQESVRDVFNIALCASDAFYDPGAQVVRGDPVEAAVFRVAGAIGLAPHGDTYRDRRQDFLPFSSELRFAAGVAVNDAGHILCVNGAPETLLAASRAVRREGEVVVLTDDIRTAIEREIEQLTASGQRLVAVAFKQVAYDDIPNDGSGVLCELVFAGVMVFSDPVRDGVADSIKGVQEAGAKVLLITGDNPATAGSIAAEVGIAPAGARVVTGGELQQLSDVEIEALLSEGVSVFARVLPQQKLRIAQLLQKRGEIVAMTGDGINDAPALRKANIGVAIGSGTEVAKESSDLVLVNDTFATIYAAIEEGRRVISNLRKIVGYLLSTSLSEVVLIGAALLTGAAAPISAAQILWANIIEEGFMSVAFAFEKGETGAMKRRPQDIHEEGVLSRDMLWFMAFVITILSSLSLGLYFYLRSLAVPFEELRSAMFLSIAMDSLFMAFAFRSLSTPIWKIPLHTNLFFVGSFMVSALLLGGVLSVPVLREFLDYTPLPPFDIALVVGVSLLSLVTIECGKFLFFERRR